MKMGIFAKKPKESQITASPKAKIALTEGATARVNSYVFVELLDDKSMAIQEVSSKRPLLRLTSKKEVEKLISALEFIAKKM